MNFFWIVYISHSMVLEMKFLVIIKRSNLRIFYKLKIELKVRFVIL
jgi:hypothetical protein